MTDPSGRATNRSSRDRADDLGSSASRVSRRSYLAGLAGFAGLAGLAGFAGAHPHPRNRRVTTGGSGSADPGGNGYRTIEVPPGGHYRVRVGDGGAFGHTLIDISAPGATFKIDVEAGDWVVRNVGIRGEWDIVSDGHEQAVSVAVPAGATGVIDTFYFGDGCPDDTYPGVTGIYVQREHAGQLTVHRANIQDVPNNAVYASTMGRPAENSHGVPGGDGGVVAVRNSYAANCRASHFRIGTTGSVVENCVAVGGDRGVWTRFGDTRVVDSDLTGHYTSYADGDLVCGSHGWAASAEATTTLENTVFGHSAPGDQDVRYGGTIRGESADRPPRTSPPEGVPLSAEEAATGDPGSGEPLTVLRVAADRGDSLVRHAFTVRGELFRGVGGAGERTGGPGDAVRVRGIATGLSPAEYWFSGSLTDWEAVPGPDSYRVTLLDRVGVEGPDVEHTLTVLRSGSDPRVAYEFTVEGTVERVSDPVRTDVDCVTVADRADVETGPGSTTVVGSVPADRRSVTYRFDGRLVAWASTADPASYALFVDGLSVGPGDIPESVDEAPDAAERR